MEVPPLVLLMGVLFVSVVVTNWLAERRVDRDMDRLLRDEPPLRRERAWLAHRDGPPAGRGRGPCTIALTPTRLVVLLVNPQVPFVIPLGTLHRVQLTHHATNHRRTVRPMIAVTGTCDDGIERSLTVLVRDAAQWSAQLEKHGGAVGRNVAAGAD